MTTSRFSLLRIFRLGSFNIASAMADILLTAVWNRVMISDLGMPATLVGFFLALRYFLAPLSVWAGLRSDSNMLAGLRRTPFIWLGRGMMVGSLPLLAVSMNYFDAGEQLGLGWALVAICFLLFGIGTVLSGSTYLALVRDSAPLEKQGLAVSIVFTILILFFPISAIVYARWMPVYDLAQFQQIIYATSGIIGFIWFIATVGVEKGLKQKESGEMPALSQINSFNAVLKKVWGETPTRSFFIFFAIATTFAWLQDAILEPMGASLFELETGETTDFSRIWLGMTAITLIASNFIWRNRPPEKQRTIASGGLIIMGVGTALIALATFTKQLRVLELGLAIFGSGFGVYSFGAFSVMAVMTTVAEAGAYLGMWTVVELLFKGGGTFLGGILLDVLASITNSFSLSYGIIFTIETIGILVGVLMLTKVDVIGWAKKTGRLQQQRQPVPLAIDL